MMHTRARTLLLPMALLLLACNNAGGGADKAASAAAKDEPAADDASPAQCSAYASALCSELGADTPACESARDVVALMPPAACKAGLGDMAFTTAKLKEKGKRCTELMDRLCKDLGEETDSCKMVRTQTPKMPPTQCEEMLAHYDEVLADLQRHEAELKPLDDEARASIEAYSETDHGARDAAVTVVEFSDFECPYCSRAATAVQTLKKKFGDRVRVVFRHYPLPFHQNAKLAATASLAAGEQGKFWQFHDRLFDNQRQLSREDLEKHAEALGLDMEAFRAALDKPELVARVDADMKLGEQVHVSGTPTMFINGARVPNPTDPEAVAKQVESALQNL